jgi:peptidoglycan/xylan/chitin deacetylase (PgdA/CDA1 family)
MYHSVSEVAQNGVHPYYQTVTTPRVFAEHMKYLSRGRYKAVTLADAVRLSQSPGSRTEKVVVVTFDDGFRNFYTDAFPILDEHGFTATVFLPTAYIGETALKFKGRECLTWSQIRELRRAGVHFGSHTVTHPQLRSIKTEDVQTEVRASKATIEDKLSAPVKSFAYPFAFPETDRLFRQRLRVILEDAGYDNGVSTIIGTADRTDNRFFMKRLPVNSRDDPRFFRAKLEGAYDWLHTFQYVYKLTLDNANRLFGATGTRVAHQPDQSERNGARR